MKEGGIQNERRVGGVEEEQKEEGRLGGRTK